ncbi:SDR family NAD(P)-dependent oxidoreductase [Brachybacterium huguangmaarense]
MTVVGTPLLPAPDLTGRTVVLTGGSDGVGRETAFALARWGARLILPVRSRAKGEAVRARLVRETGRPDAATLTDIDLASMAAVRAGAERIANALDAVGTDGIDALVHVAGGVTRKRTDTVDGFEQMVATHALAPMLLTELLLPRIRRRVVVVASHAHTSGRVDPADLHLRTGRWGMGRAYASSKLLAMLWGLDLSRTLRDRGSAVDVQLVHPGWVLTNLQNASGSARLDAAITAASRPLALPAARGAESVLLAATQPLPPCSYVGPDGPGALRGEPTLLRRSAAAADPELAAQAVAAMRREVGLGR